MTGVSVGAHYPSMLIERLARRDPVSGQLPSEQPTRPLGEPIIDIPALPCRIWAPLPARSFLRNDLEPVVPKPRKELDLRADVVHRSSPKYVRTGRDRDIPRTLLDLEKH